MQNKHARIGNVLAGLWMSARPQMRKMLVRSWQMLRFVSSASLWLWQPDPWASEIRQKTQKDERTSYLLWYKSVFFSGCTCAHVRRCPGVWMGPRWGSGLVPVWERRYGMRDISHPPNYSPVWAAENTKFVQLYAELLPAAISASFTAVVVGIVFTLQWIIIDKAFRNPSCCCLAQRDMDIATKCSANWISLFESGGFCNKHKLHLWFFLSNVGGKTDDLRSALPPKSRLTANKISVTWCHTDVQWRSWFPSNCVSVWRAGALLGVGGHAGGGVRGQCQAISSPRVRTRHPRLPQTPQRPDLRVSTCFWNFSCALNELPSLLAAIK